MTPSVTGILPSFPTRKVSRRKTRLPVIGCCPFHTDQSEAAHWNPRRDPELLTTTTAVAAATDPSSTTNQKPRFGIRLFVFVLFPAAAFDSRRVDVAAGTSLEVSDAESFPENFRRLRLRDIGKPIFVCVCLSSRLRGGPRRPDPFVWRL